MLNSKYQRVGALAGLLLFFGAWLTGYYDNWLLATITVILVSVALWVAVEDEANEELGRRATRGFIAGVIAAVVARVLGLLTMAWAFDSWSSPVKVSYDSLSDAFRVMFNGNLWATLIMVLGAGAVGAFIAYAMPYFTAEREEE